MLLSKCLRKLVSRKKWCHLPRSTKSFDNVNLKRYLKKRKLLNATGCGVNHYIWWTFFFCERKVFLQVNVIQTMHANTVCWVPQRQIWDAYHSSDTLMIYPKLPLSIPFTYIWKTHWLQGKNCWKPFSMKSYKVKRNRFFYWTLYWSTKTTILTFRKQKQKWKIFVLRWTNKWRKEIC